MIVVVGNASYRPADANGPEDVGGLAGRVALAAVTAGAAVEFVVKVGDDAAGDALVLALGRVGIGHAAVLRDAGHPTPILAPDAGDDAAVAAMIGADLASDGDLPADRVFPEEPDDRPRLESADLELALRYLAESSTIVGVDVADPLVAEALAAGAAYAGAQVIVVVAPGASIPPALADAIVLEAPDADPDGAFARLVGGFAAAVDDGVAPATAFRAVVREAGWESASA